MTTALSLERLLIEMFDDEELRRFVVHQVADGEAVLSELPGPSASLATVVHALVRQLVRRGLIDEALFDSMRVLRSHRSADIDAVIDQWQRSRPSRSRQHRRLWWLAGVVAASLGAAILAATQWRPMPVVGTAALASPPAQPSADSVLNTLGTLSRPPPEPVKPTATVLPAAASLPSFPARAAKAARRTIVGDGGLELVTFSLAESKSLLSSDGPKPFEALALRCGAAKGRAPSPVCAHPDQDFPSYSLYAAMVRGDPQHDVGRSPFPIFTVVLRNTTAKPAIVTQIRYRVHALDEAKFMPGQPLLPTARYIHEIHHTLGDQLVTLEAPFMIEPGSVGDFELELRPISCVGCGWLMEVLFTSDRGDRGVGTGIFQVWMSKSIQSW